VPITANDALQSLRKTLSQAADAQFSRFAVRHVADPVTPEDSKGHFRINRLILWLAVLGLCATATFFYFTYTQP
jgi:hypothetical protein